MQNKDVLLEVKDLHVSFFLTEGTVRAVDGVNFDLYRGKTLGVVGESGCGKSVTARAILNMVRPPGRITEGQVLYHGQGSQPIDLTKMDPQGDEIRRIRWGEISMIFQEPMTSLSPVHTIGNQMIEAIRLHTNANKQDATGRAVELLGRVGLPQPDRLLDRYRHELSGGMRQRVMIAMALSCNPKLLIADEPTTALDVTTQAQILDLMRDLQEEFNMAIMFITHDLGVIAEMADDVVVMYLGKEVEVADVDTIYYGATHPYTQALLRSIPRPDQRVAELATIKGTVPDPTAIPVGCAFHPRCPHYDRVKCANPPFLQVKENQWSRCARVYEINPHVSQTEKAQ
ncbi:MAG: dipeptide/oligopeptide/nickel ABC transporter ATP-binding protein [Anaerolineaceae bacterium]|nr:dipeptide/oligopeptide/nickel ABC transporter ATP-binding protein [Anaerolineaceae bacterium]